MVNLIGVRADDFATGGLGDKEGHSTLPAAGGAGEVEGERGFGFSRHRGRGGLAVFAAVAVAGLPGSTGWADFEFPAHVVLAVEFGDGPFGFVHGEHLDEGKSFAALGIPVIDDFHILHFADSIKEVGEVTFRSIVAEVANMEAGGSDGPGIRRGGLTGLAWNPRRPGLPVSPCGAPGAFFGIGRGGAGGFGFGFGFGRFRFTS